MRNIMCVLTMAFAVAGYVESANAAIILSVSPSTGANSLANNSTGQTIDLFGYSDTGALTDVLGINLAVQIVGPGGVFEGPAGPPSPGGGITFTGISSIWDAAGFNAVASGSLSGINGAIGVTDDDFADATTISGDALSPSYLGRFNIDTTGVVDQFATLEIVAGGSSFVFVGAGTNIPVALSAPYQVTAIPEPASFAICGLVAGGLCLRRRRAVA
ncbi:hypothetical protein Q31b_54630 [Novipirellula aureliae]|uniref:PEP-CTERM protein-sorting domain-containing protein n=1 Tax=Novipirellula aureliae TaxID=2527966 RepID=A0A5C6DHP8_9BACT|nr:hypothetical protein [Novipirellula aureliae]TWU35367.1 hypothetical protein Q31b_54630 [Novipirellula aureliae]